MWAFDVDRDGDAVADVFDSCPDVRNPDQQDTNWNGMGDACESAPQISVLLNALLAQVASYGLDRGLYNALTAKLDGAVASWERSDSNAPAHELGAFIRQVNAQRGKKISEPEADALGAAATEIMGELR